MCVCFPKMGISGDKVSNKRNLRLRSGSQLEGTVIIGGGVKWLITLHPQPGSTELDPEPSSRDAAQAQAVYSYTG